MENETKTMNFLKYMSKPVDIHICIAYHRHGMKDMRSLLRSRAFFGVVFPKKGRDFLN